MWIEGDAQNPAHTPLPLSLGHGQLQPHLAKQQRRDIIRKDLSPLMLSIERSKAAHVLDHGNTDMIEKHNNTNVVQIPPRTETRLITEGKPAADGHTRSIAACFHLSPLAHKRVELSLCRFDFRPPNPAKLKQPIQQLPKDVESRIIVTFSDNLRKKCCVPAQLENARQL